MNIVYLIIVDTPFQNSSNIIESTSVDSSLENRTALENDVCSAGFCVGVVQ